MARYRVWRPEVWYAAFDVEAEDELQAIDKVNDGLAQEVEGSMEYSHIYPGGDDNYQVEEL